MIDNQCKKRLNKEGFGGVAFWSEVPERRSQVRLDGRRRKTKNKVKKIQKDE
jgi:hypothetical protein